MNYYINGPDDNANIVELWSLKRLPFQPQGWLYDMRGSLIEALARLVVGDDDLLYATYQSEVQEVCDLENILLYNVGAGKFKQLSQRGFLLERSFHSVEFLPEKSKDYLHYQRYELVAKNQQPLHWIPSKVLAEWDTILLLKLTADNKPQDYWKAIKENEVTIFTDKLYNGFFGLEIELVIPERQVFNPAAAIKSLADGIISAFHAYQGEKTELVAERLAFALSCEPDYINRLLLDTSSAFLGSRRLLHPFKNHVQWNPVDDKCVLIKLTCQQNPNSVLPQMKGRLFKVIEQGKSVGGQ